MTSMKKFKCMKMPNNKIYNIQISFNIMATKNLICKIIKFKNKKI